ncbi:MAG: helix-turn-helix domain-containing protein, partial [Candidatus Saccharimonadales bacterium]
MRNISMLHQHLARLNLSKDETAIFISLLDSPKTQLEVSRTTGIARSNVYRIVDGMTQKGLVSELTTGNDKLLSSANPEALELLVTEQEIIAEGQRQTLNELLPLLSNFELQEGEFSIKTYKGLGGLKQMLWNELRASGEILVFSGHSINVVTGRQWAEKYRLELINRGLSVRALENGKPREQPLSDHDEYTLHYHARYIPEE